MGSKLFIVFLMITAGLFAKKQMATVYYLDNTQTVIYTEQVSLDDKKPNPVFQLFKKKHRLNKKITAAVLAFPFPFGIVGLHRIYLGTKPYVPVAYIASLGGGFGILPFIDFCVITFSKDITPLRDNGKVFMWVRE